MYAAMCCLRINGVGGSLGRNTANGDRKATIRKSENAGRRGWVSRQPVGSGSGNGCWKCSFVSVLCLVQEGARFVGVAGGSED